MNRTARSICSPQSFFLGTLLLSLMSFSSCKTRAFNYSLNSEENAPCPKHPFYVRDQGKGAWIFTWTRSDLAMTDPNKYIQAEMNNSLTANQQWLDLGFEVSPSLSQGYGVYFAGDPLQSYGSYGPRLVVARLKALSEYRGGRCAAAGSPIVFNSDTHDEYRTTVASTIPGLLYPFGSSNFVSSRALVLRGNEMEQLLESDKTRVFSLEPKSASNEVTSIWRDPIPTAASDSTVESLIEPFMRWIVLANFSMLEDANSWISDGNLTPAGVTAAAIADTLNPNSGVFARYEQMKTGPLGEQLTETGCARSLEQCVTTVHGVLKGWNPDPGMATPLFAEVLKTLGLLENSQRTFVTVDELRTAFLSENQEKVSAEKMQKALALIEDFRKKLRAESLQEWTIPRDAY